MLVHRALRPLPLLLVLAVLAGCQRPPAPEDDVAAAPSPRPTPEEDAAPDPAQPAEPACGPVERPPLQGGNHLIGDQEPPVPYTSTPPTSGWHTSGAFEIAIHGPDDPLSEPRQVSVLEAGGVVVTYHELPAPDRQALEALVRDEYPGRVSVTPYDELAPGEVALTAWGVLQRCDGLDLEAVAAFVDEHAAADPPQPGHQH